MKLDIVALRRPIITQLEGPICGDATLVLEEEHEVFLANFDATGHGLSAHNIANKAMAFIESHVQEELSTLITLLHQYLQGTNGGVVSLCRISKETLSLSFSGIGNISACILYPKYVRFYPREGILGQQILPPTLHQEQLESGSVLILSSDGIKSHLDPTAYSNLYSASAYEIARNTMDNFSKSFDDASCIIVKVLYD